jgi:hypothetical protein
MKAASLRVKVTYFQRQFNESFDMAIYVHLLSATRCFQQKHLSHFSAVGALELWQRRFFGLGASVLVALLAVTATCAEAKEPVPNIKDLVGMTNGSNTDEYPLGWRKLSGCTYGRSLILCSMLKNGKQEGIILQKLSLEPKKNWRKRTRFDYGCNCDQTSTRL